MRVREVLDWLLCKEPNTGLAAGVKIYAEQMLRNFSGGLDADLPSTYQALEKVLLDGSDDWEMMSKNCQWMPDREMTAKRMGIDKEKDLLSSNMTKIQGAALKSAFLLIWAEMQLGRQTRQ